MSDDNTLQWLLGRVKLFSHKGELLQKHIKISLFKKEVYHRNKFKNKVITITLEQSYFEGYKYISIRVNENS